ncbi:hypothetical protein COCMIDRAFT_23085 [Bipolaris oryzae ATCC 44560]|uniref:Uncharacterized protein n=1 Tax=Bipolaris oryzae ATCC 44560 TaxID=930090 RepID=W6ZBZ0_COCMI|nr:uncharacterized protein COCMIDRAFT_23085 [Bipolaris oryzae ATCC 44560]EUC49312.1 hypothetical protein COCMIDRAFT_23085 [Bipolaris oryzae ATCC 44560]
MMIAITYLLAARRERIIAKGRVGYGSRNEAPGAACPSPARLASPTAAASVAAAAAAAAATTDYSCWQCHMDMDTNTAGCHPGSTPQLAVRPTLSVHMRQSPSAAAFNISALRPTLSPCSSDFPTTLAANIGNCCLQDSRHCIPWLI